MCHPDPTLWADSTKGAALARRILKYVYTYGFHVSLDRESWILGLVRHRRTVTHTHTLCGSEMVQFQSNVICNAHHTRATLGVCVSLWVRIPKHTKRIPNTLYTITIKCALHLTLASLLYPVPRYIKGFGTTSAGVHLNIPFISKFLGIVHARDDKVSKCMHARHLAFKWHKHAWRGVAWQLACDEIRKPSV